LPACKPLLSPFFLFTRFIQKKTRNPFGSSRLADRCFSAHIWLQDFRNSNRTVFLLAVLQNRRYRPSDSKSAAVQRMDEFRLAFRFAAELDVRAARLEIFKV